MAQLSALALVSPALPTTATTISVDTSILPLVIQADTNTVAIDVVMGSVTTTLTKPALVGGKHQFSGALQVTDATTPQVVQITGNNYGDGSQPSQFLETPTVQFQLLYANSGLATTFGPPSGITVKKGQNSCDVQWAVPTYAGFLGVRVQWSTDSSGVNVPYQQFGGIVSTVSSNADVLLSDAGTTVASIPNPTQPNGTQTNTVVTTNRKVTVTTDYASVTIPYTTVNSQVFYVILTALVQDPVTNQVYESQAVGPFRCGFVDLQVVKPTDFLALQQSSDIASRLISELTRRRPDLDLTARSEIRDLIINPLSLELANMSVREWFSRCARSISALSQIDDTNGDGVSDPVASSPFKQQISRAYGLDAASTQTFIDQRFDILGESAGITRGGATASTVILTFYTYNRPTADITIPAGILCSTVLGNLSGAATLFVTLASATMTAQNAAAYYDATNGWWAVSVPAQSQGTGLAMNVGAETITQVLSGGPSGLSVINLKPAENGLDRQSNADYAAQIRNRQVVGKDTGTRYGYWETALGIPGIIDALVVAAGDVDMVRDWSALVQKHTYGCVDVYVRGNTTSQQTELHPFSFPTPATHGTYSTYLKCTLISATALSFKIANFSALNAPIYTAIEMTATSAGNTIWLGVANAQFDNVNGVVYLSPTDQPYVVNADGTTTAWQLGGASTTNLQFLQAISSSTVSFALMAQLQTGFAHTPTFQPVTAVDSIIGPNTGAIASNNISLVHTNDFLLTGGSNNAGDTVRVSGSLTYATSKTLTVSTDTTTIDSDISVTIDPNGKPGNILSVRSSDLSKVYTFGVDYKIVPTGPYRTYALFIPAGSSIPVSSSTQVVVAYYKFLLTEHVTLRADSITLSGSAPAPLSYAGFVRNTWLPANHGATALLLDGASVNGQPPTGLIGAGVAPQSRYIKVTYNNGTTDVVMLENKDFTLAVDSVSGAATLTRVTGGALADGGTVTVLYYTTEVFTVATEYPAYVQQAITAIEANKHAAADVLVKAMVASPVDLVMNVVLDPNATPSGVDGTIRTQSSLVIVAADTQLFQSAIVRQVDSVVGVRNVELPLLKCAKADKSYDIARVVPTGTAWLPLSSDTNFSALLLPPNSYISEAPLLPYPTIPSGGQQNDYVGLLYKGQAYRRAMSVADFLTSTVPSFYIIGTNDKISAALPLPATYSQKILLTTPASAVNPALYSYFCTYQIYGAASSDDINVASCEYLVPGSITINYVTES